MSRDVFEIVKNGPYGDGWNDITCVGADFQEQHRRVAGQNEFRYRPVYMVFATFPKPNTTASHISVRHQEPWLYGPSPDGSGRNFK